MRTIFLLSWLCALVLLFGTSGQLPEQVGAPGKQLSRADYQLVQAAMLLVVPWLSTFGALALLRRLPSGGINLPHRNYWFSGERRAASLERLAPLQFGFGLLLVLLLAALHGSELLIAQGWELSPALRLGIVGLWLLAVLGWVLALLRAFPKPPEPGR